MILEYFVGFLEQRSLLVSQLCGYPHKGPTIERSLHLSRLETLVISALTWSIFITIRIY